MAGQKICQSCSSIISSGEEQCVKSCYSVSLYHLDPGVRSLAEVLSQSQDKEQSRHLSFYSLLYKTTLNSLLKFFFIGGMFLIINSPVSKMTTTQVTTIGKCSRYETTQHNIYEHKTTFLSSLFYIKQVTPFLILLYKTTVNLQPPSFTGSTKLKNKHYTGFPLTRLLRSQVPLLVICIYVSSYLLRICVFVELERNHGVLSNYLTDVNHIIQNRPPQPNRNYNSSPSPTGRSLSGHSNTGAAVGQTSNSYDNVNLSSQSSTAATPDPPSVRTGEYVIFVS